MKAKRGPPIADAIVLAAKAAFAELGYENASMDDVAARAGTTKRTLYNHFASKEELFRTVVVESAELFLAKLPRPDPDAPVEGELERFAVRFVELCCWRGAVGVQRVVLAEANRFPDLGRLLHAQALGRAEDALADYFKALAERGALAIDDPLETARLFLGMTAATPWFAALFGASEPLSGPPGEEPSAQIARAPIRAAVTLFLRAVRFAS